MKAAASRWLAAMPVVFVLIWSTGFIVARYAMPHAGPLAFLSWRYALSLVAFALWLAWSRPAWPRDVRQWLHLAVTGVFMHAGYLGGVWVAVKWGMSAGMSSLIVGLQPVLTALWQSRAGAQHRVSSRQWMGLCVGLTGVLLVVWRKLGAGEISSANLAAAVVALGSITAGTLYQKRFVRPADVRCANAIQLAAALVVTAPWGWLEGAAVEPVPALFGALAWSVLGLTLGGSSLLFMLIQRGAATSVASLMYLVPPCTALLAWLLFGELLSPSVLAGLALTAAGVALVVRDPAAQGQNSLSKLPKQETAT